MKKERAKELIEELTGIYPDSICFTDHEHELGKPFTSSSYTLKGLFIIAYDLEVKKDEEPVYKLTDVITTAHAGFRLRYEFEDKTAYCYVGNPKDVPIVGTAKELFDFFYGE